MKKIIDIALIWVSILIGLLIISSVLFSCSVSKPQNSPQIWTVVSVNDTDFRARWGKEYATFNKLDSDSVYIGKKITVSRGIK